MIAMLALHQGRLAQDAQPDQGVRDAGLDDDERGDQRCDADEGPDGAHRRPADLVGGHDGVDQQQHRRGGGHRAEEVVAAVLGRLVPRHERDRRGECDQRDRHREQERPAPADAGHQASEDQAERVAARAEHGVDRERLVARGALGEVGRDDREPRRRGERRGQALDEAGEDQQRSAADQAAGERRDREDGERDQEDLAPAEQVGRAAAEEQQSAVAEDVAADQPLERRGREVELRADRGQRDADHRDVQSVEEQDDAESHEESPRPPAPGGGRRRGQGRSREGGHGSTSLPCVCIQCNCN